MSGAVAEYIRSAFKEQNVTGLLFGIHIDLNAKNEHADVYVAIDKDTIYILEGQEQVKKTDGAKRLKTIFVPSGIQSFKLEQLGELKAERMISTGRLISKHEDTEKIILSFSIGLTVAIEKLIKAISNIREGKDVTADIHQDEDIFCPKCGLRYPEPERKICPKCLNKMSISVRLMSFFKDYSAKIVMVVLAMLGTTAFSIISPYVGTKLFLDEVLTIGGKYYGAVLMFILILFLVRFLGLILGIVHSLILAKTVPWIVYDLKLKIFTAMQHLSVGFYTSKQTGSLMDRVNRDSNNIYWFFVDGLPYVLVNIFTFTAIIVMMCIQNLKLALITLFILPTCIVMFKLLFSVFRRMHHKFWVYNSHMSSLVSDSLNGQRVIKVFAREDDENQRFAGIGAKLSAVEVKSINIGFTAFPLIYLYLFLGQVVITAIGGIMVINGEITLGTLLTFFAYLSMLYGPIEFMSWVSNWWSRCVDSAQRVFEIIDAKPDVVEPDNPVILKDIKGDIVVEGVKFSYEPAVPILKDMSLEITGGHMLGIVGKTGAGKTTIANLIARLYDVGEGRITIDGVDVRQLSLKQLRENIGIVSQEMYLFIGSIADNIRYAKPDATIEEVIAAAKAASAHDFIMNLPDAYETRVGAGGQDLSGGERQRLSIARTIIQNPKILILDEATAAMDVETEMNIQKSLNSLKEGRTTIAIAHRLSTLRDAERLAVINDGKVVESGTHDELMIKMGEYHKLYTIQMEALKVINMDA